MFKLIRFILRVVLLLAALASGILFVEFFLTFRSLSIEQLYDIFTIVSSKPLISIAIAIGILLFVLSLLGLVMLLQYQIWRYPLSVFAGYVVGVVIYYHFYLLHPFQENALQLNNNIWYYPLLIATLLLLRAVIGFKLSTKKKLI